MVIDLFLVLKAAALAFFTATDANIAARTNRGGAGILKESFSVVDVMDMESSPMSELSRPEVGQDCKRSFVLLDKYE